MGFNKTKFIPCIFIAAAVVFSGCAMDKTKRKSGNYEEVPSVITSAEYDEVDSVYENGNIEQDESYIKDSLNHNVFHFNFDSSALQERDYDYLDTHVAYYTSSEGRDLKIRIEGHTDQVGTRSYNLALGERRANAVKDYLESKGVSGYRIEVVSYGFEKPIIPGFTKEACAANRRAVISSIE